MNGDLGGRPGARAHRLELRRDHRVRARRQLSAPQLLLGPPQLHLRQRELRVRGSGPEAGLEDGDEQGAERGHRLDGTRGDAPARILQVGVPTRKGWRVNGVKGRPRIPMRRSLPFPFRALLAAPPALRSMMATRGSATASPPRTPRWTRPPPHEPVSDL